MVRKSIERDGLVIAPANEFEMFETNIHIYLKDVKRKYTKKNGTEKTYNTHETQAMIRLPTHIVRYLDLKHKDKLIVAICRAENFDITEEISNNDPI